MAGYYHQALAERKAGNAAGAAALFTEAARRFPSDPEVQMFAAQSLLVDQKNPQGAIDALAAVRLPADNRFMHFQYATLQADAFEAAGQKDAAIAALQKVAEAFPNPRLQQRIDTLRTGNSSP
jgi:tetratricopeptide (TPR) repeat protein